MAYKNYFSRFSEDDDDSQGDLFTGFQTQKPWFKKERAELIEPYLHYIDEKRLHKEVEEFMSHDKKINEMYSTAFNGMKKINRDQFIQDTQEFYQKELPKELISDMFNLYHKQSNKLKHKERNDKTKFRYKVLDHTIDPVNRLISEKSSVKSMIMTRNMVQYFCMMMAYQKQVAPEEYEQMKNDMQGQGNEEGQESAGGSDQGDQQDGNENQQDGNQQGKPSNGAGKGKNKPKTPEGMFDKLANDQRVETLLNQANENAQSEINDINEVLDDDEQEAIWNSDRPDLKLDKESIKALVDQVGGLKMNMSKVKEIIAKLLNKSKNYFNGKPEVSFENIFEASSIDGIEDYHLLHPKLRQFFTEDIMVRDTMYKGKINLYIDTSGSMTSYIHYDGKQITGIDFAKSFAMQMHQMGLIENLYLFDTSIEQIPVNQISIAGIGSGGGTRINIVAEHINQQGVNAIVVTDAQDNCNTYAENAYFIGILGASFNYFTGEVLEKYSNRDQMVEFDGSTVWSIDKQGRRAR